MDEPIISRGEHWELVAAMRATWRALEASGVNDLEVAGTAAYWLTTIDEFASVHVPAYTGRRASDGMTDLVRGIAFARNTITHSLTRPIKQSGLTFPIVFPISFGDLVWAPGDSVEQDHVDRGGWPHSRAKRHGYRVRLQGRPYKDPLKEAAVWQSRILALPSSADAS